MNRPTVLLLGMLLAAMLGVGQSAIPAPAAPPAIGHGAFPVMVSKTLDSSKLKEGDRIEVETSGSFKLPDGTMVPKGSLLEGQVIMAKARSKGDPDSQLTLTFDKLSIAGGNGKQLSIKGTVQAVFPPAEEARDPQMAGAASVAAGGGIGSIGTVDTKSGSNSASENRAHPVASTQAMGVQGIDNLQLENGVLTSKGKNVKLGSGVRMIVHADIFG